MNNQSAPNQLEALRAPAVTPSLLSLLLDPVQRTWDAAGYRNRGTFLHAFGFSCELSTMFWDELHYTVQIVLRAHIRRFLKSGKVAK